VARQEILEWRHFDYLLISDSVDEDLRRMLAVLDAEKMRSSRSTLPLV
jgi:guanylate kinase